MRDLILRLGHERRTVLVSTHNLDEVERVATRVAVLRSRLVAVDTPAALRARLFGTRVRVVLGQPAYRFVRVLRDAGFVDARDEGTSLSIGVDDAAAAAPQIVRALVEAGADIQTVTAEKPPLEEVYLRLLDERMTRALALLEKELADLRQNPAVFLPAVLTGFFSILLPFFVAIIVPQVAGERLSDSSDFQIAIEMYRNEPSMQGLDPEGAMQAWIFQQFLVLLVLTPVAGSMSVAAYSVIGEKQARTLEPLLATPITTFELLAAKVLGSLLPAVVLTLACFGLYVAGVALFAQPGVFRALFTPRVARHRLRARPAGGARRAAARGVRLVARQRRAERPADRRAHHPADRRPARDAADRQLRADRCRSSRSSPWRWSGVNAALMLIGIALFDRESILTRWK